MQLRISIAAFACAVSLAAQAQATQPEETAADIPDFPGREETFNSCIACHSFRVVGRQGMSRARWDQTLDWMSEKHNMPALQAEDRKLILDYLEKAYPADAPRGWQNPFAPK